MRLGLLYDTVGGDFSDVLAGVGELLSNGLFLCQRGCCVRVCVCVCDARALTQASTPTARPPTQPCAYDTGHACMH